MLKALPETARPGHAAQPLTRRGEGGRRGDHRRADSTQIVWAADVASAGDDAATARAAPDRLAGGRGADLQPTGGRCSSPPARRRRRRTGSSPSRPKRSTRWRWPIRTCGDAAGEGEGPRREDVPSRRPAGRADAAQDVRPARRGGPLALRPAAREARCASSTATCSAPTPPGCTRSGSGPHVTGDWAKLKADWPKLRGSASATSPTDDKHEPDCGNGRVAGLIAACRIAAALEDERGRQSSSLPTARPRSASGSSTSWPTPRRRDHAATAAGTSSAAGAT